MRLFAMTLRTALRALRRNKLRSSLTTLGVVIGVAAVILMVSIGQGASEAVRSEIEALGTNLLMIVPGATTKAGVRSGWGGVTTLTVQDARAIAEECEAIAGTTWIKRQIAQVIQGELNWSTSVQGVSPGFADAGSAAACPEPCRRMSPCTSKTRTKVVRPPWRRRRSSSPRAPTVIRFLSASSVRASSSVMPLMPSTRV